MDTKLEKGKASRKNSNITGYKYSQFHSGEWEMVAVKGKEMCA